MVGDHSFCLDVETVGDYGSCVDEAFLCQGKNGGFYELFSTCFFNEGWSVSIFVFICHIIFWEENGLKN